MIENGVATHKFCGSVPPELITSDSESVTVNFVTQKPSTGKGFEALFLVAGENGHLSKSPGTKSYRGRQYFHIIFMYGGGTHAADEFKVHHGTYSLLLTALR